MIRYKLVTKNYKTRKGHGNETTWEIGKRVEATGDPSQGLCSDAYVHCYDSPHLALLMNPVHASIPNPRLLEVRVHGRSRNDYGLKRGYRAMTPVKEISCPPITKTQRVRFAILCVLEVYHNPDFVEWANNWLEGRDRTAHAANAANAAAHAANAACAARATANAAAYVAYAVDAAYAAVYAANAAVDAAYAVDAVDAVDAANAAVNAAAYAASAAAYAAYASHVADAAAYAAGARVLDLVAIAEKACTEE